MPVPRPTPALPDPRDRPEPAAATSRTRADDGLLSLTEVAEALGVHYMTAYRYVRTGALVAHQARGRWRVTPTSLAAFRAGRQDPAPPTPGRRARRVVTTARSAGRRRAALTERLLAGDEAGAWRTIEDALAAGWDLHEVYLGLVGASMGEVGDRWEAGQATVADEHRASVVAMRLIGRLGPRSSRPGRTKGTVVMGAAPGDRHALPSALLADLLRLRGVRVVDLGADTPPEYLAAAAAYEDRLLAVGICATTALDGAAEQQLRQAVRLVHERAGVPVLLGGRAVHADVARRTGADGRSRNAAQALAWFEALAATPRTAAGPGS